MTKKIILDRKKFLIKNKVSRIRIKEDRDLINGIRMNRNERVEDFPQPFLKNIFSRVKKYDLGKYPDQSLMYKKLSKFLKIDVNRLLLTSGIDGSIKTIFEVLTRPGSRIGILRPTYAMYKVYSGIFKTKIKEIGYDPSTFKLNKKNIFSFIKSSPEIIFLPNPNQPIEDPLSIKNITKICQLAQKYKVLVVIDEAYHMFGTASAISLINKFKNLIILRTFSKSFGIPSIRFGYVVANENIINILSCYRLSYESNLLTDVVAGYFIDNIKYAKKYIFKVKKGRDYLKEELKKINIKVIGGKSNFLLINFRNKTLYNEVSKELKKNKIYVKSNYPAPLDCCILITCGPKYLMKKFLNLIIKKVKKYKQL